MNIFLSKTKIKQNHQCEKQLWLELTNPKLGKFDDSTKSVFDQGRKVESLMHDYFKSKFKIIREVKSFKNKDKIEETKKYLNEGAEVIFEASFLYQGTIIQFDALVKKDNGSFFAVEVKSSTSQKPDHVIDMTIQYWVASAEIKLEEYYLYFVNKKSKSLNPEEYFEKINLIKDLIENKNLFDQMLNSSIKTSNEKSEPQNKVGKHCSDPYKCKFWDYCFSKINQSYDSPLNLPNFKKGFEAINNGIISVLSEEFIKTYPDYVLKYPLIMSAISTNSLKINHSAILAELSKLTYPLAFFDFETVMSAFPIFPEQTPYQQVVVQFSSHLLTEKNELTHSEFLWDKKEDPSRSVAEAIVLNLKNAGSIISYNKTFEKTQIANLAQKFPDLKEDLDKINSRFYDLLDLVKAHVYHPSFKGSYSLKEVSPALLGEKGNYSDSIIKNGNQISSYFLQYINLRGEEKEKIGNSLKKYCFHDTLNLYLLFNFLKEYKV